jgi:hypothetical protein
VEDNGVAGDNARRMKKRRLQVSEIV